MLRFHHLVAMVQARATFLFGDLATGGFLALSALVVWIGTWCKSTKALMLTWIVYLIVIHVRQTGLKDRGLTTAWLSVAGFIVMLWTYFGVNLLLPGLHAYA